MDRVPPDAHHTPIRTGNSAEDAALLALSFRALADALKKLAREEEMFERRLARWARKAERDALELTFGNDSRRPGCGRPGPQVRPERPRSTRHRPALAFRPRTRDSPLIAFMNTS